jgi:hypothetical protein
LFSTEQKVNNPRAELLELITDVKKLDNTATTKFFRILAKTHYETLFAGTDEIAIEGGDGAAFGTKVLQKLLCLLTFIHNPGG